MEDINPETFNEHIDNLNEQSNSMLNEFKKIYILSKMNPTNQEYEQQYSNMMDGLNQVRSKLSSMTTGVQTHIDELNQRMIVLNAEIQAEKKKNNELKKKLGIVEDKSNTSAELINDYVNIYDERYLRNWGMGIGIVLCIGMIGTIFKKQNITVLTI